MLNYISHGLFVSAGSASHKSWIKTNYDIKLFLSSGYDIKLFIIIKFKIMLLNVTSHE